ELFKTLDLDTITNTFAQRQKVVLGGGGSSGSGKQEPTVQLVSLLDSKRAYNVSLQLGSIRGMTYEEIRDAIITLDETKINEQNILTFKQIAPTPEETDLVM